MCDQIRLGTIIKIIGPLFPYWQAKIISFSYALLFKRKTSNFLNLEFVSSKNRTSNLKKILILVHSKPSRSNQVLFPDRNGEFSLYYTILLLVPKQSCGTSIIISESSQVMSNSRSNLEESSLPSKE